MIFFREDEKLVARVVSSSGGLSLSTRTLNAPPEKLAEALRGLARSQDFVELPALGL